jgi:hypothetical protein
MKPKTFNKGKPKRLIRRAPRKTKIVRMGEPYTEAINRAIDL